jgi:hypothetical protein
MRREEGASQRQSSKGQAKHEGETLHPSETPGRSAFLVSDLGYRLPWCQIFVPTTVCARKKVSVSIFTCEQCAPALGV